MKKETLAQALHFSGLLQALLALRKGADSPWITVLTYHRAAKPEAVGPYDDGVVDVSPDAFDRQLEFLKRWFSPISLDDLRGFLAGRALPKNPVLVTFDDGYRDNHDVVLPLLRKHGMRAVFFIATTYLDERRLFWWDRINYLVKTSSRASITLSHPKVLSLELGAARPKAIRKLLRIVKDHYDLDLDRFLDGLAEACDVSLSPEKERALVDDLMMTWDEVRALRAAGMAVQSHTCTHRVLQTLPPKRLEQELVESRRRLEEVLGEAVTAVSYPVGKPLRFSPHIRKAVRDAGYELGFSNASGINHVWNFDPFDAKRLALDFDESDALFRASMAIPYLG